MFHLAPKLQLPPGSPNSGIPGTVSIFLIDRYCSCGYFVFMARIARIVADRKKVAKSVSYEAAANVSYMG
jgi:hypothetical protein